MCCIHGSAQCVLYSWQCTVCVVFMAVHSVCCIHGSAQCVLYSWQCTVYVVERCNCPPLFIVWSHTHTPHSLLSSSPHTHTHSEFSTHSHSLKALHASTHSLSSPHTCTPSPTILHADKLTSQVPPSSTDMVTEPRTPPTLATPLEAATSSLQVQSQG